MSVTSSSVHLIVKSDLLDGLQLLAPALGAAMAGLELVVAAGEGVAAAFACEAGGHGSALLQRLAVVGLLRSVGLSGRGGLEVGDRDGLGLV